MDVPKMIVPMILDRILADLTDYCHDQVDAADPLWVSKLKIGRWQEDPVTRVNHIAILGGDSADPDMVDGLTSLRATEYRSGFYIPTREVGGTEMWYRRGIVEIGMFFTQKGYDEDYARSISYALLGRVERRMPRIRVADLRDDSEEHGVKVFMIGNTMFQSGGPPASYIWRAKVKWQCLTERSE